jgi:hypothetical protein
VRLTCVASPMSLYARPSSHGKRWCVRNLFPWVRVCSAFFLREPRRCSRAQSAISPLSARPGCPIEYQDRPRPAQAKGRCLIRTPATVDKSPSRRFFGNTVPLLDRSPSCKYSEGLSSSAVSLITPRRGTGSCVRQCKAACAWSIVAAPAYSGASCCETSLPGQADEAYGHE